MVTCCTPFKENKLLSGLFALERVFVGVGRCVCGWVCLCGWVSVFVGGWVCLWVGRCVCGWVCLCRWVGVFVGGCVSVDRCV